MVRICRVTSRNRWLASGSPGSIDGAGRAAVHQAGIIRDVEVGFLRVRIVAGTAALAEDRGELVVVGDLSSSAAQRGDDLNEQHEARSASKGGSQKTLACAAGSDPGHNNCAATVASSMVKQEFARVEQCPEDIFQRRPRVFHAGELRFDRLLSRLRSVGG